MRSSVTGMTNKSFLGAQIITFLISRSRDYCTSGRHVVSMCVNVIKVSVYLQVREYASIDLILVNLNTLAWETHDQTHTILSFNSLRVPHSNTAYEKDHVITEDTC